MCLHISKKNIFERNKDEWSFHCYDLFSELKSNETFWSVLWTFVPVSGTITFALTYQSDTISKQNRRNVFASHVMKNSPESFDPRPGFFFQHYILFCSFFVSVFSLDIFNLTSSSSSSSYWDSIHNITLHLVFPTTTISNDAIFTPSYSEMFVNETDNTTNVYYHYEQLDIDEDLFIKGTCLLRLLWLLHLALTILTFFNSSLCGW